GLDGQHQIADKTGADDYLARLTASGDVLNQERNGRRTMWRRESSRRTWGRHARFSRRQRCAANKA
ncbi:MAG: hypothetical protein KGJ79_18795, partial [Alphaproteobacteria bacterium]|nr:hypothetical protein [Alphaproteobacteria bacterium]